MKLWLGLPCGVYVWCQNPGGSMADPGPGQSGKEMAQNVAELAGGGVSPLVGRTARLIRVPDAVDGESGSSDWFLALTAATPTYDPRLHSASRVKPARTQSVRAPITTPWVGAAVGQQGPAPSLEESRPRSNICNCHMDGPRITSGHVGCSSHHQRHWIRGQPPELTLPCC